MKTPQFQPERNPQRTNFGVHPEIGEGALWQSMETEERPAPPSAGTPSRASRSPGIIAGELAETIGEAKVALATAVPEAHAGDKWSARALPDVVVTPEHPADIVAVMKYANQQPRKIHPVAGENPSPNHPRHEDPSR